MRVPKRERYQDYVIKDGVFVGEFEQMYQDYDDPWLLCSEILPSDKALALHWLKSLKAKKVIELGSGLGQFSNHISLAGLDVLGIEVSSTAVKKARKTYPNCEFHVGDIMDFDIYHKFKPDVIIMSEVTWYVLDQLDDFLNYVKRNLKDTKLIHLLVTYPPKVQQYGLDKFTSLPEIMDYFKMDYDEWAEFHQKDTDIIKTCFLASWK